MDQLPAVALTAFADTWPRAIETEIGTALCAIGAGRTLILAFDFFANAYVVLFPRHHSHTLIILVEVEDSCLGVICYCPTFSCIRDCQIPLFLLKCLAVRIAYSETLNNSAAASLLQESGVSARI